MPHKFGEPVTLTIDGLDFRSSLLSASIQSEEAIPRYEGITDHTVTLTLTYSTEYDPMLEAMFESLEDQGDDPSRLEDSLLDHEEGSEV